MNGLTLESRALLRMTERALQAEAQRDEARAALVALQAERDAAIDVAASATRRADAAELGLDHALTAGEQGLVGARRRTQAAADHSAQGGVGA